MRVRGTGFSAERAKATSGDGPVQFTAVNVAPYSFTPTEALDVALP